MAITIYFNGGIHKKKEEKLEKKRQEVEGNQKRST
jgi:hypothetical protein